MILIEGNREVEIPKNYDVLANDLILRWGFEIEDNKVLIKNIDVVTSELSAWGIPWKRTKWDF